LADQLSTSDLITVRSFVANYLTEHEYRRFDLGESSYRSTRDIGRDLIAKLDEVIASSKAIDLARVAGAFFDATPRGPLCTICGGCVEVGNG